MTTKNICIEEHTCGYTSTAQKSEPTVWNNLRQIASTIRSFAAQRYQGSPAPEPQFPNGGARVLIRPDRIDLI
jgi:hypothetical protein